MKYFDFSKAAEAIAKESDDPTYIIEAQHIASKQGFPPAVKKAGFVLLQPESILDLKEIPHAVVIGVALWSLYDMRALDSLAKRIAEMEMTVFVLDLDECMHELNRILPGVIPKYTPAIGEYKYGTLVNALLGHNALSWMTRKESFAQRFRREALKFVGRR